ncbi:MAG: hypothetical protein AAFN77_18715 [Planctomycetota bacterium]
MPLERKNELLLFVSPGIEEQYTELFTAVDENAERIGAKGSFALGRLAKLAATSRSFELDEDIDAVSMVRHLISLNEKPLDDLRVPCDPRQ